MFGRAGRTFGRMGQVGVRLPWYSGAPWAVDFAAGWTLTGDAPADLLTTTRASDAYADTTAGVWSAFSSNVPRITDRGLRVEGARTNSVRNNSMQGASAPSTLPTNWAPGGGVGITVGVVGTGAENGVDYIDIRWSGTTGSTFATIFFDAITAIAASNGQTWTNSAFVSLVGGSFTNVTAISLNARQYDSGSGVLSDVSGTSFLGSVTAAQARFNSQLTTNNASVAYFRPFFVLGYTNGAAIDFTLRIGWPQFELGAFATAPIRTTSAAATRAADVITTARAGTAEGAVYVTGRTAPGVASGVDQNLWQWDDGTADNRLSLYRTDATAMIFEAVTGGVTQAYISLGNVANSTDFKIAASWAADEFRAALNGVAGTADTSGTVPTGLTTIRHGSDTGGSQWFGLITREALFDGRRSDNQIAGLTA